MACEKTIWSGRISNEKKKISKSKAEFFGLQEGRERRFKRIPVWLLSGEKQLENTRQSSQLLIPFVTTFRCVASILYNGQHKSKARSGMGVLVMT
jgi:hypothetical protein